MLHRTKKDHDENAGKWIGVGGKIEAGETPGECVRREVREETGFVLAECRARGVVLFQSDVWGPETMYLFTAEDFSGSMTECDEGDLAWVPEERVEDLPLWEGDRIFLRLLRDAGQPYFFLKLVYTGERLCRAELDGKPLSLS